MINLINFNSTGIHFKDGLGYRIMIIIIIIIILIIIMMVMMMIIIIIYLFIYKASFPFSLMTLSFTLLVH